MSSLIIPFPTDLRPRLPAIVGHVDDLTLCQRLQQIDFVDTTALKANVHFPVDWVLLRDATRALMKALPLIRREGLKARMEPPAEFLRRSNRLCLEMTHSRRKAESRKERKRVWRGMKKLVKVAGIRFSAAAQGRPG